MPLIFRLPGKVPAGARFDDIVTLEDILPTVLDLLGINKRGLKLDGRSLLPRMMGGGAYEKKSDCLDLPPTILALMGLSGLPEPHGRPLPGIDYGERMSGWPAGDAADGTERRYVTSSSNGQQFGMFNTRMITDGRHKYVWNLTDTDELYDTERDPGELTNLVGEREQTGRLKAMRAALYEELQSHGDPFASHWLAPQLLENRKA